MTLDEVKAIVARVQMTGPFADKWIHVGMLGTDLDDLSDAAVDLVRQVESEYGMPGDDGHERERVRGALAELQRHFGSVYVQVRYMEADIYDPDGPPVEQRARIWVVAPDATESQVVQICFGAHLASAEHQVREFFTYEVTCGECGGRGWVYHQTTETDAEQLGCRDCQGEGKVAKRVFGPHHDIEGLASVAV